MKCEMVFWSLVLTAASTVWGYVPPVDEKDGVRVAIESFPQTKTRRGVVVTKVRAAKSGVTCREFPVTLSNLTAKAVSGRLDVWLNDDWNVAGPAGALTLAPGEGRSLVFAATAKPSALSAYYPVHARFTREGGAPEAAAHPIAIFEFNNPRAPRNAPKTVTLDVKSRIPAADRAAGLARAKALAREAIEKGTDPAAGRWRLEAAGATYGAGAVFGPNGLIDGALAFTDGTRDVVYDGFPAKVTVARGAAVLVPRAEIREEKGTLRVRWTIGAQADESGVPLIADLAPGAASERPVRFYAGFGNVYQNPKRFTLVVSGFHLSTRHIGVDYANGLSVVQAADTIPRNVACDSGRNICSMHVYHDATFTFVPSVKGSFEAARRFRAVAGYRKSPGHDRLGSRQCLDQWEGDYRLAAADLARAAKYGLTDSFFIKHMWQRWGYDYRLPDIFPPAEDPGGFKLMREAARKTGILFCPHDNYTDIYPDADTYSYDLVCFSFDGLPQRAWNNSWRLARSFRWAPHAIHPWVRRNAGLLQEFCDPDGVFIDVLTCIPPFDYLDRSGRFHSKCETTAHWRQAFTEYREAYGKPDAITISEAGHDFLLGTVDAGECDHMSGSQLLSPRQFGDSERTPWHDIVSHGYYTLLAGGVAGRYLVSRVGRWDEGGDAALHGYASDDYLCTCIMGGRNPMSDGPFSRTAVKTYWMQHDACAELGRAEFLDLDFADGDIHRQHSTFSDGGEVWVNRGKTPWTLPALGVTLPTNGYYAKTRTTASGVLVKDGVRFAFAKSPAAVFVDARTPARPEKALPPRSREAEERDPMSEVYYLRGRWDSPVTQPQDERDRLLGTNRAHRPFDFGGIVTDGSFRFIGGETLIPLPDSAPFTAKIDLSAFGAKGRRVARVEAMEPEDGSRTPRWTQTGDALTLDVDARAFAYRLVFPSAAPL